jgi:hypothetical protein
VMKCVSDNDDKYHLGVSTTCNDITEARE